MKPAISILALPHIIVLMIPHQGWQLMFIYIALMFLTLKLLTLTGLKELNFKSAAIYTTAWIGMNPIEFTTKEQVKYTFTKGILSLLIGAVIFYLSLIQTDMTIKAILVFTAVLFIFHFGLLDLNAQIWAALGRKTKPIMNEPWKALSLAEFWGKRWNMAFRDAAHQILFKPIRKSFGVKFAILSVFIFSGLVHETVISLPAEGGYGGPMVYFLLQYLGLCIQKEYTHFDNRFVTWLFLVMPLPLLFHKAFFLNVFIPFSNAIGG